MLPSMGMEDNGFGIDSFDCSFDDFDIDQSFSSESYNQQNNFEYYSPEQNNTPNPIENCINETRRPAKQLKTTNSWTTNVVNVDGQRQQHGNKPKPSTTSSNSLIISFDSKVVKPKSEAVGSDENRVFPPSSSFMNQNNNQYCNQGMKTKRVATSRTPLHALDHVIAERKRREKLSQRFIALSAVVPGLKKTDKASVLEDTIKYLKNLQERVKTLEEETVKKTVESAVFVKKSHFSAELDNGSSLSDDETFDSHYSSERSLPEIEARVQDKDVLIRIHCEKRKGCTLRLILDQIEKLRLTVTSTSVLPFGSFTLDITIVAKMDNEFPMTVKEIVRSLRQTY
ncbi:hypothetical protein ACFE04_022292 [Oxalis oulophora]